MHKTRTKNRNTKQLQRMRIDSYENEGIGYGMGDQCSNKTDTIGVSNELKIQST